MPARVSSSWYIYTCDSPVILKRGCMTKEESNYTTVPTCYNCNHCHGMDMLECDLLSEVVVPDGICDKYESEAT